MLSLTRHGKRSENYDIDQAKFSPIIITNKLPKQVSPKRQQKYIVNSNPQTNRSTKNNFKLTNTNHNINVKTNIKKRDTQSNTKWIEGGAVRGAFDKKLQRNQLAAEQRRLRAEMKKQKQLAHQQIIINEKNIAKKGIKMTKDKDEEIQYLQRMIEKQKKQKQRIDEEYEIKKRQIEKQRQQLIELERRIQREGIKEKQVIRQVRNLAQQNNMVSQDTNTRNNRKSTNKIGSPRSYQEPTQSQTLHQKNNLRQQQLEYLMTQRQNAVKGLPNINYSPTLIPLLSKASYKIISTHVSQIVELLVDQMLEEQVYLLEQIQLQEQKEKQRIKQKNAINEYYEILDDFVGENEEISQKVGKYSTMNFADLYKPKHYPQQSKSGFVYETKPTVKQITLDFEDDQMQEIENRKERFMRFVGNFDEYKKSNMKMFEECTQEMIDQAILKLAKELEKGSGQFVDIVFRNQFN